MFKPLTSVSSFSGRFSFVIEGLLPLTPSPKRFDTLQTGPSNKEVAALDKVKNNIALAAFDAQRKAVNGVKFQDALPSSYWDAMMPDCHFKIIKL